MARARTAAQGRTLGTLVKREGRENLQKMIIAEAQNDPVFARSVVARPRETLEKFLGIKIPERIYLSVVQETAGSCAIVIPAKEQ